MIPLLASFSNPFVQGGMGAVVVGSAFSTLKSIPTSIFRFVSSKLYINCVIENDDTIYRPAALWIANRPELQKTGRLQVISRWEKDIRIPLLAPGDGDHVIKYDRSKFWITISSSENAVSAYSSTPIKQRAIRIRCKFTSRHKLEKLLEEVVEPENKRDDRLTKIYVNDGKEWRHRSSVFIRPLESLILDTGLLEQIVTDAKQFFASSKYYLTMGIPYRRGYLLYGYPGNGKSSLVLALAGALSRSVHTISLGDTDMTDAIFRELLSAVPMGNIVLIEDIDTVFVGRDRQSANKLTLSGVLNAIDGPLSSEGRLLIMTSNHPERLDVALVRPGRVDMRIELKNANETQARRIWERFRGKEDPSDFLAWAADGRQSMATLQSYLLEGKEEEQSLDQYTEDREIELVA